MNYLKPVAYLFNQLVPIEIKPSRLQSLNYTIRSDYQQNGKG